MAELVPPAFSVLDLAPSGVRERVLSTPAPEFLSLECVGNGLLGTLGSLAIIS